MEKKTRRKKRWLRRLIRVLFGILIFFILLVLFIRSPWGQNIIVQQAVSFVSEKTGTKVEIEKLYLTFSGNIYLEGLYLEDTKGDTLIFSKSLEANIPFLPIIKGKGITVNRIEWNGLRANIIRKDSLSGFNYNFLIDAFVSEKTPESEIAKKENEPLVLRINRINLSDFKIIYQDDVTGTDTQLSLGELNLKIKALDLEAMKFHIAQVQIANTSVKYLQTIVPPAKPETDDETILPFLIVDELRLDNLQADYHSIPDGIATKVNIQSFLLELPKADLANQNIEINRLALHNSGFLVEMTSMEEVKEQVEEITEEPLEFVFPDWSVVVNNISFKNNAISYFVDDAKPKTGEFNPSALDIHSLELLVDGFSMKDNAVRMDLESLRFTETSGVTVKSFGFGLHLDQNRLSISGVDIHINDNILQGNMLFKYHSLNDLLHKPESVSMTASFADFRISVKDAFIFAPELKKNEYVSLLSQNNINGNLKIQGSLSELKISEASVGWKGTSITARGSIKQPLDTEKMMFDFPHLVFITDKKDISLFVNEEEMGVSIPEKMMLNANFSGKPNDLSAVATLETTEGTITLKGGFSNTENIIFQSDIKIKDLAVGKILKNEQLGTLDFSMEAIGKGNNLNDLDATLDARIERFSFNDYAIEDLRILGQLDKGKGNITTAYKDENIDIDLNTSIVLDSIASHIIADLDMRGINLKALGVTDSDTRGAFKLHADFKGNAESFVFSSNISDGIVRQDDQTYLLGDFEIQSSVDKNTTSVDVISRIIQAELRANTHPQEFSGALQHHFRQHFSDTLLVRKDTLVNPLELKFQMKITEAPLLSEVLLTGIERMDTISINLDFNEKQEKLLAEIQLPHINYNNNILEGLSFQLNSKKDLLDFSLGFKSLDAGPLAVKETSLKGRLNENTLNFNFSSFHDEEKIIDIYSGLAFSKDTIRFHLEPNLILNRKNWEIPEKNNIVYTEKHLDFNDFKLSRGDRTLEISSKNPRIEKDHVEIIFEDFRLSDLLGYLNPEKPLAHGRLDGDFVVEEPFGSLGFLASLEISELEVLEIALGNLSLDANAVDTKNYDFQLALNGGDVDLNLNGNYSADETDPVFRLDMALNELKLKAVEKLSNGEMENSEGSISGNFKVGGSVSAPQYDGNLEFNNIAFLVKKLNAQFKISEQSISINNKGMYLNKFNVRDEKDNTFIVDGAILTNNFSNPDFDLKINAKNFNVLNSTEQDNALFYGTAGFDLDAMLTGNLNLPKLKMRFDLLPSTNITYVMTESDVQVEERDGVVLFVNRDNPDNILTKNNEEEILIVSGVDVEALFSIKRDAAFNIIINKQTGDNLRISGEGDLNLDIDPNGRMNLTGRYEVQNGHFEMNLYNLVKRRFEIAQGSNITWSGDPMDASLDIRAIYRVETSASSLMAAQTSGMDVSEAGRFRQRLPFLVYLNIGGEITQPELSFNIDMPEEERGAIGGQVYNRLQQIDSQEDERNRQVFSLLVLNRFFPDSGSDGSGGGVMAVARNNLNQALSDQLNNLSGQLLGNTGIELDFGLNSYTDYQGNAPQDRTQLDITAQKKLFDDRLILSVGSEVDIEGSNPNGESAPVIGNVAIEYLLTEDGRYRLKGFRKNQYENVIDGQIFVNGIALIFSKEFNKYSELWRKETEEEKKKKSENNK